MKHFYFLLLVFGLAIVTQSLGHAKVSPMGLNLSELKTAAAKDKNVSSPLEKGYSSDYRFWESYGDLNAEIQIWISKNTVTKAQWVYGGESVNSNSGSKKEFDRLKIEYTDKLGKPTLDSRTKDWYVAGWDNNKIITTLSLELPTTKYGLPILKVIQTMK